MSRRSQSMAALMSMFVWSFDKLPNIFGGSKPKQSPYQKGGSKRSSPALTVYAEEQKRKKKKTRNKMSHESRKENWR